MGKLDFTPAARRPDLLAAPVAAALADPSWPLPAEDVGVAEIDAGLADTAAFCERYGVSPAESANCVVIAGRREGETRFAACVVLATTRADVDVAETAMEYGGITPIGLPAGWPVLVDAAVAAAAQVVIGSGVRRSKLALAGKTLTDLPGAVVIE